MKAPIPDNEAERIAALRKYQILDTCPERDFDDITWLASQICQTPVALVTLVDSDRQWFKSKVGVDIEETPRDVAFCAHSILQHDLVEVSDATLDERFADNPFVTSEPHVRFYAAAPLVATHGETLGTLCVIDTVPRTLSPSQAKSLTILCRMTVARLDLRLSLTEQAQIEAEAILMMSRAELEERVKERTAELAKSNRALQHEIVDRIRTEKALQKAEQKYRSIFENAIEGIFQSSPGGFFLSANPALARIYGYDSPQDLIQSLTNISDDLYLLPNSRSEFIGQLERCDHVSEFEAQVVRKDGSVLWITENARAVRDSKGVLLYYEGTVEDITERKAVEAEREILLSDALKRADHDPLTWLPNHRAFHKRFAEEAERTRRIGTSLGVALIDMDNFHYFNEAYGHPAGDEVLRRVASALGSCCGPGDILARFGGDEFALILPDVHKENIQRFRHRVESTLNRIQYSPPGAEAAVPLMASIGVASYPEDAASRLDVLEIAAERLQRAKSDSGGQSLDVLRVMLSQSVEGFSMLQALVNAVDTKDRYTRRHSEDVMIYSLQIADQLGLGETVKQTIEIAALLHDVGKIGVPDRILRKPGKLTDEEFEAIKQHPQIGAIIIGAVPGLKHTLDAVRHHHERWDGRGYPLGTAGEETPLIARVMSVADSYSAMTTDRPYRKGIAPKKALSVLTDGAGTQWDDACVQAFVTAQSNLKAAHRLA